MNTCNFKEIRELASLKCQKNSSRLALIYLVYFIFALVLSFNPNLKKYPELLPVVTAFAIVSLLVDGIFQYGISKVIKINYHGDIPTVENLFDGFKVFGTPMVIHLLQTLFIVLWSLLLIIPGIIKALSYSMAYYVSLDNPDLLPRECIDKSSDIMDGHKTELFVLMLSYIGWILLSALTFGILLLWVRPKIETAKYEFYLRITNKNK